MDRIDERQGDSEAAERDVGNDELRGPAFVLAAGEITGADQAALFVRILPKMLELIDRLAPPFLVRVSKGSRCDVLLSLIHI